MSGTTSRDLRLDADLALPGGRLRLGAGEVGELPDDPRYVAALTGEARDRRHRIHLDGWRADRRSPARRVRAGLVTVGVAPVAPDVTVVDHLAAVVPVATARRLVADTPRLAGLASRPAGLLSGGERRLLAWTMARVGTPGVVLLDRAGTGLDAEALSWADRVVAAWLTAGVALVVRVGRHEERRWLHNPAERSG